MGDARLGTEVAGYRIEALLGRGGMSRVYLAEDARLGRKVALKLLDPELAEDERFRERFMRESRVAASLEHPNIIPIHEAGEAGGQLFIAMRHVRGTDLSTVIREQGPLPSPYVATVISQVASALDAAHAEGLIHRDVKPANVLMAAVSGSGSGLHAYLSDFGLTRGRDSTTALTRTGQFMGSIDYASPEQFTGSPVDERADVYALGCMAYECLTGGVPFDRTQDAAVMYAHLHDPPPNASEGRPDLGQTVDQVIRKAMAKEPGDRYETCGEFAADLAGALGVAVAPPPTPPRRKPSRERARGPRPRQRRLIVIGIPAVALVTALVVVAAVVLAGGGGAPGPDHAAATATRANTIAFFDPGTGKFLAQLAAQHTCCVHFGEGAFWAVDFRSNSLVKMDPKTHHVVATIGLGIAPNFYAFGLGSIWVTDFNTPTLLRVDPVAAQVVRRYALSTVPNDTTETDGVVVGAGSVWVAQQTASKVLRVDPQTGRIVKEFDLPAAKGLTYGAGEIWVAQSAIGHIVRIDPDTNAVTAKVTNLHPWICCLQVAGGSVWAPISQDGVVWKLDATNGQTLKSITTGRGALGLTFGAGKVWTSNSFAGSITSVDPTTDEARTFHVGHLPDSVAVGGGQVAVVLMTSLADAAAGLTGRVLHVVMREDWLDTTDPAIAGGPWQWQMEYATCAKLLNYPDRPAPEGWQLQPEVATAMPTVSDGGRTYRFQIRPGFVFSPPSNQSVTAETFQYTIERALSPQLGADTPAIGVVGDIVGAQAFHDGKASTLPGVTANGDTLTIRLTKPAPDFLTRISLPYFCAVPTGTPIVPGGVGDPIPSAGPFYLAAHPQGGEVLKANPNYGGTRERKLDGIIYTTDIPTSTAISLIQQGKQDYDAEFDPALKPGAQVDQQFGADSAAAAGGDQRYFLSPNPGIDYIAFNTAHGLFADAAMRKAVNEALDRPALAAQYQEIPAAQILPPGMPGFRDQHVYPVDGPDVAAAKALTDGRGGRAVFYVCPDPSCVSIGRIVTKDLQALGIDVQVKRFADPVGAASKPGSKADMVLYGGFGQVPDPVDFLQHVFDSGHVPPGWLDGTTVGSSLDQLARLSGQQRLDAAGALDARLTREEAPIAAYATFAVPQFFSARVGCKVFQPLYFAVDLAALCLQPEASPSPTG